MKNNKGFLCILLASCLGISFAQEIQIANEGIGGETTVNGLYRLYESVICYRPQHLILNFGTNDISPVNKVPPELYEKSLKLLVDKSRAGGVKNIVIITAHPIMESYVRKRAKLPDDFNANETVLRYREIAKKVAAEKNTLLLDLYALTQAHGGAEESADSLIRNMKNGGGDDGTHFNSRGYQLIADELYEILKDKVQAGDRIVCLGDSITYGANLPGAGTVSGQNYPSYLWRKFNPERKTPTPLASELLNNDGNYLQNSSFEKVSDESRPYFWHFWQKKKDTGAVLSDGAAPAGKNYYRLSSDKAGGRAFFRTDFIKDVQGPLLLSYKARGQGNVLMASLQYFPAMKEVNWSTVQLTPDWTQVEIPITIPDNCRQFTILFQPLGTLDLDDVHLSQAKVQRDFGKCLELKNQYMTIGIASPEKGGGVISIRNAAGVEYLNQSPKGGAWAMHLEKLNFTPRSKQMAELQCDPELDDGTSDSKSSDVLQLRSEELQKVLVQTNSFPGRIEMSWRNIPIGEEADALDVLITYTLGEDGYCHVTGAFENRSNKFTVFYFQCPRLTGLGGINGNFAADEVATPCQDGRLIRNPIKYGLFNGKRRRFSGNNAGHSLQFDLYCNNGNGLYFGTFDPMQYTKRYETLAEKNGGICFSVNHIPTNIKKNPQRWQTPYSTVFRIFSGDWFDGCMLYRKWAIQQIWCQEGPLYKRNSTPQWFKEMDEWCEMPVQRIRDEEANMERLAKDFATYNMGGTLCYWGYDNTHYDSLTPERFPLTALDKKYLDFAKKHKFRTLGYLQQTQWSTSSSSYKSTPEAQQNMVRNFHDQIMAWGIAKEPGYYIPIPYPGEVWKNVLNKVVEDMAHSGFDGVYLDSGNHGGNYFNFTPAANSEESGGGIGYVHGIWAMDRDMRRRAREINPEFCLTAESFWEGNIHVLDGHWTVNTTNVPMENDRVVPIPMVHAVYHDYTIFYGHYPSRYDIIMDNAKSFTAKTALSMAYGVKSGCSSPSTFYGFQNSDKAMQIMQNNLTGYAAARKFLVYGTMLRPPRITNCPKTNVRWCFGYREKYQNVLLDSILSSAWRAPDGSFGLFLYNLEETPLDCSLSLDCAEYGLVDNAKPISLNPVNFNLSFQNAAGKTTLSATLPSRTPVIMEFK